MLYTQTYKRQRLRFELALATPFLIDLKRFKCPINLYLIVKHVFWLAVAMSAVERVSIKDIDEDVKTSLNGNNGHRKRVHMEYFLLNISGNWIAWCVPVI